MLSACKANFCKRDQRGERGGGEGGEKENEKEKGEKERERRKRREEEGGGIHSQLNFHYSTSIYVHLSLHHPLPLLLHTARNFVTPFSLSRLCPSSTSGHRCLPCTSIASFTTTFRLLLPPHICYLVLAISVSLEVSIPIHWVISDI